MVTIMTTTQSSPLGSLSVYFKESSAQTGGIKDCPTQQCIELYPAGYTKPSKITGESRQEVHKLIWTAAQQLGKEELLFPFEGLEHNIKLVREPENAYDKFAVRVMFTSSDPKLALIHNRDLGYIPRKISKQIFTNLASISGGRILKVRENFHDKYYTTKIVLSYHPDGFERNVRADIDLDRFDDLLED